MWMQQLSWSNCHVSAMLDDDVRAPLCSIISLLSLWFLVGLEMSRAIGLLRERLCLAVVCGLGILVTCVIREGAWWHAHAASAVVAFAAGLALVLIITMCYPGSYKSALALSVVSVITGTLQSLSILQWMELPSVALALGEGGMILTFGVCVATVGV
jgi:hypothetical protein